MSFALAAAIAVAATDVLYTFIVSGQSVFSEPRVRFEMMYIGVLAVAAILAAVAPWQRVRVTLLSFAIAGLFLDGLIAIFSVGALLILAALLAAVALREAVHDRPGRSFAIALPVGILSAALLLAGLALFPLY